MRKIVQTIFVVATCWLLVSCSTHNAQIDLAKRFVQLQDAGKLPGFPRGADGEIHMEPSERFGHITYPYSRDIFVMRADDTSIYTYHFVKDTSDSEWQLTKAWIAVQDGPRSELKVP